MVNCCIPLLGWKGIHSKSKPATMICPETKGLCMEHHGPFETTVCAVSTRVDVR